METTKNKPLVIIGTGLAGIHVAKEFRKLDQQTPLVLLTQDDGHFYSKPQLSTALCQAKTATQLIVTEANTMMAQLNAKIHTFATVDNINAASKQIQFHASDEHFTLDYAHLVLALGAEPKPFPALDNISAHYRVNNRLEYAQLMSAFADYNHLAIIGSGLVGCEFAHDFASQNKKISIITLDSQPLNQLVPACIGQGLQRKLESMGICFYTNAQLNKVHVDNGINLQLNSTTLKVDAVLTAIGLKPHTTLAAQAGLQTRQGIVVDDYLKTSDAHIYALGDCAEFQGICRQYVAPILQSARALAQTLSGNPTKVTLPTMPIALKVSSYPVIVQPPLVEGQWHFEESEDGIKALFVDNDNKLQGYALSGSGIEFRAHCLKTLGKSIEGELFAIPV